MPVDQQASSPPGVVCKTGGHLLHKEAAHSRTAWFLVVRRQADEGLDWEFQSPLPALLWMRHGFRRFKLDLDGRIERSDRLAGPG